MAWIMNDVICRPCDSVEVDCLHTRGEDPPKCHDCGGSREVDLRGITFSIRGDGPGSFAAVDFGVLGKAETREDYDRCIKTIEERFPGKRVNIQEENHSQKQTRLDKIRHDSWSRKKARGLDAGMLKEISTHNKRRKQEGRPETKSAAQLAGNK